MMNVLVIGSGGREHAIVWKISQSPKLKKLYALPGNPGTAELAENLSGISVDDHSAVIRLCKEKQIDLVIVGPEAPLAAGLADSLWVEGIRCFGPKQAAAKIESSKVFAKDFMARHHIPTARYATFSNFNAALKHLHSVNYPIVIKASGLAAGKGVILPETIDEAGATLEFILINKVFGNAGAEVVIEERLVGQEVSLMAFTDGTSVLPMLPAQDHKRLLDGDQGPNTGGMGAYAPAPIFTADMLEEAMEAVLKPAVNGLKSESTPFVGVLYAGLMLTPDGIRVLEFNCRFGDPETQSVIPLLEGDLLVALAAAASGELAGVQIGAGTGASVTVVLAAGDYPAAGDRGSTITGVAECEATGALVFHAGTAMHGERLVTNGGRVLGVTGLGPTIAEARASAYEGVGCIEWEGMRFRSDVALAAATRATRISSA